VVAHGNYIVLGLQVSADIGLLGTEIVVQHFLLPHLHQCPFDPEVISEHFGLFKFTALDIHVCMVIQ